MAALSRRLSLSRANRPFSFNIRRLSDDDQWVVPHNLLMTMFSTSSVNVPSLVLLNHVLGAQGISMDLPLLLY